MGNKVGKNKTVKWQKCKNKLFNTPSFSWIIFYDECVYFINDEGKMVKYDENNDKLLKTRLPNYDKSKFAYFIGKHEQQIRKLQIIECVDRRLDSDPHSPTLESILIWIDNNLHIIGGDKFPFHVDTTNISFHDALFGTIDYNYSFSTITKSMSGHSVIYIQSSNELLLFFYGDNGNRYNDKNPTSYIYSYPLKDKTWTKRNEIEVKLWGSTITLVPGDEYIIISNVNYHSNYKSILIYDIKLNKIFLSKVGLPFSGQSRLLHTFGVILMDQDRLDKAVCGYIRQSSLKIDAVLSNDVIQLLMQFLGGGYMYHIFQGGWARRKDSEGRVVMTDYGWDHRKIDLDSIVNNKTLLLNTLV